MADPAPEYGHRWTTVTANDRSGILYIVTFLNFTYSSLTFVTRCFIKWHMLGLDDAAIFLAQSATIVQFALLLVSLSAGLAKKFDLLREHEYATMATAQFGNQIALYASLGLSKLATILLIKRLFTRDMKKAWITCHLIMVVAVLWTILAPLLVSVGCSPESLAPRLPSQTCPSIVARYKVVVVTDAITDIVLVVIPGCLCWHLQMSVLLKLQVLAVFSFRLPLVAFAGLFLKTWIRSLSTVNPGVDRTTPIIFQQAELCVSLMAATIPCLKSFIRSFDTGSGVKATIGSSNEYGSSGTNGSGSLNRNRSYELSSTGKTKSEDSQKRSHTRTKHDDSTSRVHQKPFTSGRSDTRFTKKDSLRDRLDTQGTQEEDRQSQGSSKELFIRREMHWEVTSEEAQKDGDVEKPGMLRLPQ